MQKFTVRFRQWVEEIASIEVEALSPEGALMIAHDRERSGEELEWMDGSATKDTEPFLVVDDKGHEALDSAKVYELIEEL